MKKVGTSQSGFFNPRILFACALCSIAVFLAVIGFAASPAATASAKGTTVQAPTSFYGSDVPEAKRALGPVYGVSYKNDTSAPLRDMPIWPVVPESQHEANANPPTNIFHKDVPDQAVQNRLGSIAALPATMPAPILNFDGIVFPGVVCNCSPPDTDGAVGQTQYVQMVNEGIQVFNKASGVPVAAATAINAIWSGFGGTCDTGNSGDPIVVYDHFANRWVVSQFRPATGTTTPITDECIAVSVTNDATGAYNRYGFHLSSNFMDYPHGAMWRDGYYYSFNVFNSTGTAFLGTQAFAFDRTAMLAGGAATFLSPSGVISGGTPMLPADVDGPTLAAVGAPETFVTFPSGGNYTVFHMHSDFAVPASSTWTTFASVPAAGFTQLCAGTRSCVPNLGGGTMDGIGDRLMFRLPYRNFGDHEAVVGNFTVNVGGMAAIRWFEMRGVTAGPVTLFQESTYNGSPADAFWRWMGSIAMDGSGDMALGFSTSSSTINPQIRYAGRLVTDPLNTLAQGEAHLFDGTGSPTGTGNRWGDYSDMTVDPVDDATFWYTQEYFSTTGSQFNWRTRIGNFKFGPVVPANLIASAGYSIISAGANGVLDPGETVTVALGAVNVGGPGTICTTSALTGTLQATGGVTSPSGPQNYGSLCSNGGPSAFRTFTFTVGAGLACGANVVASLHMQDGATDYGTLTYTFTTGSLAVAFSENFDGVVAPALPAGWVTAASGIESPWVTSTTTPNSAPNDAFAPDPSNIGDTTLDSPTFAVGAGGAQVSFKNSYNTEPTYDGEVLEISINGGAFADIITAGGSFVTGAYTGPISTAFGSPIAGRQAWNANSGGYITSTVNLPPAANGMPVKLRWRMASDNSVAAVGVRIDDITVSSAVCGGNAPAVTSAVSSKVHGAAGTFNVPLPLVALTGAIGIEDRAGAVATDHQMVVTFAGPVTVGSAALTAGTGSIASTSVASNVVTINLTGVSDQQRISVMLSNVASGASLGGVTIPMGLLRGDTNGDGTVNSGDALQTRSRSGATVDGTNFRSDVNTDGAINGGDALQVRARAGDFLP